MTPPGHRRKDVTQHGMGNASPRRPLLHPQPAGRRPGRPGVRRLWRGRVNWQRPRMPPAGHEREAERAVMRAEQERVRAIDAELASLHRTRRPADPGRLARGRIRAPQAPMESDDVTTHQ